MNQESLYGKLELTNREKRITQLVSEGLKNKEIAVVFGTTEHVVKNYLRAIYDKTGMWNRTELALWWVKQELEKEAV